MFLIYGNKHVERDRTDSSTHTSTIEKRWNIPYTNSSLGEEDFFTFNTTRLTQTILHCHHKVGIRRLPTKPPYPSRSLSLAFSCLNHILLEFGNVMSSIRDTKSNKLWLYKCIKNFTKSREITNLKALWNMCEYKSGTLRNQEKSWT